MEMIAIAVFARKFLKELEESTSGQQRARPAPRRERRASRRFHGIPGRVSRMGRAVRSWLRPSWRPVAQ